MVLKKMKETAEAYLGSEVTDAVITVPAYFNDSQRQSTKDAARIAGLNAIGMISEPTAAALAYGLDKNVSGQKTVLIYDLGGGTFDVSILKISHASLFEVKSTAGDTHLGGEDFDNLLVEHLRKEFQRRTTYDISGNHAAMQRLRSAAEQAKRALSTTTVGSVNVASLYREIDFNTSVTRAKFEDLCLPLFQSTLKHVTDAIQSANLTKNDIDEVVMIGGSTRIPRVQRLLQDYFDGKKLNFSMNPDEAVAYGAAVKAAIAGRNVGTAAIGHVVLRDIAALSLGIGVKHSYVEKLIERNTPIPCVREKMFQTAFDYQTAVSIKVYEGERYMTYDNHLLGEFTLEGVPAAPRGMMKISVVFKIDDDGILNVSAKLLSTGMSRSIAIKHERGRLSEESIERAIQDAARFRDADDVQREKVNARRALEDYTYHVKHSWRTSKSRLSYRERKSLQEAYETSFHWMHNNQNAKKSDYEYRLAEMKNTCEHILDRFLGRSYY